jgi:hypothetical protein
MMNFPWRLSGCYSKNFSMNADHLVAIASPMEVYQTVSAVVDPSHPEPAPSVGFYINIFAEPIGQIGNI